MGSALQVENFSIDQFLSLSKSSKENHYVHSPKENIIANKNCKLGKRLYVYASLSHSLHWHKRQKTESFPRQCFAGIMGEWGRI